MSARWPMRWPSTCTRDGGTLPSTGSSELVDLDFMHGCGMPNRVMGLPGQPGRPVVVMPAEHEVRQRRRGSSGAVTGHPLRIASRGWTLGVRVAYVGVILAATLANLDFSPQLGAAAYRLGRAFTPALGWRDAIDGVRNVLLFAGLGAVWALTSRTDTPEDEIRRATITGLVLSAAIEGLQTFSTVRDASIVDVLTDTSGAFAGALVVVVAIAAIRRRQGARLGVQPPMLLVAGAYLLATAAEELTPLFSSTQLELDGGPLRRLGATWSLSAVFDWRAMPLSDVPLFLAAGFLAWLLALEGGRKGKQCWPTVAAIGVGFAVAHVAHGAAGVPIHREDIVLDCAALGVGAWIGSWWSGAFLARRGQSDSRAAMVAYGALLVLWGWRPFEPELGRAAMLAELSPEHFVPLRELAERVDLFSVAHTTQQFLLYVPLGALLPTRGPGSRPCRPELWAAVVLAGAIELGHVAAAMRTFDITNALLAWAGVAVGWRVAMLARTGAPRRQIVSVTRRSVWRAGNNSLRP